MQEKEKRGSTEGAAEKGCTGDQRPGKAGRKSRGECCKAPVPDCGRSAFGRTGICLQHAQRPHPGGNRRYYKNPFGQYFLPAFRLFAGTCGRRAGGGIGSALYDLTNPAYIASAPFTFAFKFMLACVCGLVAYAGNNRGRTTNLILRRPSAAASPI